MKHIVAFFLVIFVFVGCSVKEQVVEMKYPSQNKIKESVKPIIGEEIIVIEELKPLEIGEETVPFFESTEQFKIAIIYPSKLVAKYANSSINTVLGYLSYKKINYNLKVIDSLDENTLSIQAAFDELKEKGFENVIALYTPRAIYNLHEADSSDLKVYLPLIEKKDVQNVNSNFVYGAISYEEQIKKLLEYSDTKKTMFYQESFLGYKLKEQFESLANDFLVSKEIKKQRNYFKGLVKDYKLNNSTLFLNTDNVKSSILLSQLRAYEISPKVIMSTQINYDPILFSLTQSKDMDNFVVANSIDDVDVNLLDEIATYGGNIKYEWVDYSTLVGINYLYDSNYSNLIKTRIEDNEVKYEPRLFKSVNSSFLEIK